MKICDKCKKPIKHWKQVSRYYGMSLDKKIEELNRLSNDDHRIRKLAKFIKPDRIVYYHKKCDLGWLMDRYPKKYKELWS